MELPQVREFGTSKRCLGNQAVENISFCRTGMQAFFAKKTRAGRLLQITNTLYKQ